MAQNLQTSLIEGLNIGTPVPNAIIGGMPDDELLAMLNDDEHAEVQTQQAAHDEVIEVVRNDDDMSDINALLEGLDLNVTANVDQAPAVTASLPDVSTVEILAQAVAAAESTEIATAISSTEEVAPGAKPTTSADGSDAMMLGASTEELLAELGTIKSEPAAAPSAPAAEPKVKAAKEPKVTVPRKHYADKVERLKDRVGEDLAGVSMLTPADAALDPKEALERTMHIIAGMNKKEQARASNLVEFVTGKRSSMNNVLDRVIRLLHKDGAITTGENGTVMADLLAKPYSSSSARAMGANTVAVFADLMMVKADGKGRYVENPESVLLTVVKSKLGLV